VSLIVIVIAFQGTKRRMMVNCHATPPFLPLPLVFSTSSHEVTFQTPTFVIHSFSIQTFSKFHVATLKDNFFSNSNFA
jgi:hypothetical protein